MKTLITAVAAAVASLFLYRGLAHEERPFFIPVRYEQTRSTVLYSQPGDIHIMEIQGITYVDLAQPNPYRPPLKYRRPDSAGDVTVQLWTSDGRYWHARWVEIKQ